MLILLNLSTAFWSESKEVVVVATAFSKESKESGVVADLRYRDANQLRGDGKDKTLCLRILIVKLYQGDQRWWESSTILKR